MPASQLPLPSLSRLDIAQAVKLFYANVRRDPLLAPIFATRIKAFEWSGHEEGIINFWSSIFLKDGSFSGNPMQKHLALPGLTPEHFSHWLSLFAESARAALPHEKAAQLIEMSERIGKSLQMGLAFHHDKLGQADRPFKAFSFRP